MRTLTLCAVACPFCGATDKAADTKDGKRQPRRLKCAGSHVSGNNRTSFYSCRECGKPFRVLWRLKWTPRDKDAAPDVIDDA